MSGVNILRDARVKGPVLPEPADDVASSSARRRIQKDRSTWLLAAPPMIYELADDREQVEREPASAIEFVDKEGVELAPSRRNPTVSGMPNLVELGRTPRRARQSSSDAGAAQRPCEME